MTFRDSFQVTDGKTLWAIFVWILLVLGLSLRMGAEPERRGALASLIAFGLTVASYLLVRVAAGGGLFL